MTFRRLFYLRVAIALAAGCKDDGGNGDDNAGTGATTGTTGATFGTGDSSGGLDSGDTGPQPMGECFPWDDQCGEGRKCMPFSVEADRIPDSFRCCPEADGPDLVGEPCTISDYDGSCVDSCELGSMCVLDVEEGLTGECREFCNPTNPECDQDKTCKAFFEMFPLAPNVPLCMDKCDPVLQNCVNPTWHCIPDSPTESGQSGFICTPPPPGAPRTVFQACFLANDCEAGLVCLTDDRVPGCGFASCCTAYCNLSEGDAPCEVLDASMRCVDWMAPDPEWADVGACAIPS